MVNDPGNQDSGSTHGSEGGPSHLEGLGFHFKESMSGYLGIGQSDPEKGAAFGRDQNTPARFDVQIQIKNLGRFIRIPDHAAELTGTVSFPPLVEEGVIRDGLFNLFKVDPHSGVRQMIYAFGFTAKDGQSYYLRGHKDIFDDRGKFDLVEDMTRLFTTIYRGQDERGPIYAAGELYFKLRDAPGLVASMDVIGARSWRQRLAALIAFTSFAFGALRDEYLQDVRIFYDTQYENLVLAGELTGNSGSRAPFFFVSGIHDKGFPWGDNEVFWDVLLVVGDGRGGYERYCITDRVLDGLELDIATGKYRYQGPLFALRDGYSGSFSQMRNKASHLVECQAEIEIDFKARAYDAVAVSFPLVPRLIRRLSSSLAKALREALPGERPLGIFITPHTLTIQSGSFRISSQEITLPASGQEWKVEESRTFGEAEQGSFRNVKWPTLLYNYLCSVEPEGRAARVQIQSRTFRQAPEHWAQDRLEKYLGTVISRIGSSEMLMEKEQLRVKPLSPAGLPSQRAVPFRKLGDPLLEVNNDQFPTAIFQRRIVEVLNPTGEQSLALEEDMSMMRLEAVDSDRKVTVACIRNENKLLALDQVLKKAGFDATIEAKLSGSGKSRSNFSIVIKPNFMFAYDKRDLSTYTDPELVGHLVKHLRAQGFETVYVVEAQSTYGEFFDKRRVRELAEYLGYDESAGYKVIDMTEDVTEKKHLGPNLGLHPVSRVWMDADFRISFAKNKTHAYAYYTLTLKNIYGALPLGNKFKEYHCGRGIYATTIEYLTAFPVDFGLVDAYLSADGPFGVFADPLPNETHTIIGGPDLVAVDWVAASKMGVDPMVSKYMRLAVQAFGKPEIRLIGDANPYRPWLNVPEALALFTTKGIDAEYVFGNLMYSAGAQMDETHFRHKNNALYMRLLRRLTVPVRRLFFLRTGENPTLGNRMVSWLFYICLFPETGQKGSS
jgi:uncharacterized protein (DUF362 family)